jgi:phosphoglycolate phosphatase
LKAVVFDWDLTLWNSWDMHVWIMHRMGDSLDLPRPGLAAIAQEFSRPFLQHLAWFFGKDEQSLRDTYVGFYRDAVSRMANLYPEIEGMLRALKAGGYRLAVFSDKRTSFGLSELDRTNIGDLLDYTLFLAEGRPYKPDPLGLREVMAALDVTGDETLYVGDGRQDVECAYRAGAKSGAALWGAVDREKVLAGQPDYSWERAAQILGTLGVPACS